MLYSFSKMQYKCLLFVIYLSILSSNKIVLSLGEFGNFNALLSMVEGNISAAQSYLLPKDNSKLLKLTSPSTKDFGTYDFIIVGAGSAGAVIANRLSEIPQWKILLLEAGGQDNDFTKILGLNVYLINSNFNWGYNTTVQKNACLGMENQRCLYPQGKGVGGGTTINGAIYSRGDAKDYDIWANVYDNIGWSYEDVLGYFKKSENALFYPRDADYHGVGGYFTVSQTTETPGLDPVLINGFKELGLPLVDDYNGRSQNGISKVQFALSGNERVNSASAFLNNFLQRPNLKLSLNSFVTSIRFDHNNKARGVEFVKDGQKYVAKVHKEGIVSAGAVNSAQLLMLSGIGPKKHLKKLGIKVRKNLPVGQDFQDHVAFIGFFFRSKKVLYNQTLEEQLKLYVKHERPLTAGVGTEMLGFTNFPQNKSERPEIEYMISVPGISKNIKLGYGVNQQYENAYNNTINPATDISVLVILLHPKSRGTVTLKSSSPIDQPNTNPNYLAKQEDIEKLFEGIQFLLALNNTKTFRKFQLEIVVFDYPNCEMFTKLTKDWWICAIKQQSSTLYHPASTNRMGPDPKTSVVDPTLKVHGIKGLRVADSSIIPELTSGHLMAPSMMIGEKLSDIIKKKYGQLN